MSDFFSLVKRLYQIISPPTPSKLAPEDGSNLKPIKFGILGAANIAPSALIIPAKSHPEVIIHAVAARDLKKAEQFGKKHGISKVYGGNNAYQQLLDDPEVDAVYNPLPNKLHFGWTMKALLAGKHVLCEKPMADTADEVRQMYDLAEKKGLVLLEAFHYRFHPAIQRVKTILDSGELGKIKSIDSKLGIFAGFIKESDIRFDLDLGGGAMMDMGCYTLNSIRYLGSSNPTAVVSATPYPLKSANVLETKIDRAMDATLELPNNVIASLEVDLYMPWGYFPPKLAKVVVEVKCEGGQVELTNFVGPTLWHKIQVTNKAGQTTSTRTEKVYKFADAHIDNGTENPKNLSLGEDWWLTYRYQLEAFVDKLNGRTPQTWVTREDSVANMEWIEKIYEKAGIGSRPKDDYILPAAESVE
ncbi:NAD(P)-binding protein [Rhodocollybia butyracea]|uniref:D-xylose 1-dehydrogenase (NADP(+), D-xylono-1,5-lactone-forming) n=1 Tax=Rhodocollybia butyracea TaxID=206335 RepID=A0A9P5U8E9_9AGAR|nr:NAD(P)-binding protein [Rhodocollybia butyracea]